MESPSNIMCVDDDPAIRRILEMSLRFTLHVTPVMCSSVQEANEKLASGFVPDLFLLDAMMPQIDGYTFCRELRENPRYTESVIVFLTAKAQRSEISKAEMAGADACLTKPFDPATLGQELCSIVTNFKNKGAL